MAAKIFRINYKSDFILTLNSDAGWMTPFCIKFWTGAPSQAFFVGWDGTTYTHCAYDPSEPTKLVVQFDDHHLPIGDLKFQIGYHFTVADFPTSVEDEVLNQASVIIEVDDAPAQVMLDFNGETAPEIEFSLPAYANEAQRIANEEARIAAEQQRIANEESRIAAETIRQQNEQQRIDQETARVNEFATLKSQSQAATRDANNAAALANEKAQLAADKAALADDAAALAIQKAQLAAAKAALANDAAQLAAEKSALAQQKAEYAQQQGSYAKDQGDYAKEQGNYAKEQGEIAQADHERAEADHGTAVDDHTQAGNDHTRAESDHGIAADDHTQAGNDHTRAESDHGIAADDHTQAGNDHTRAEADHTRAESDHAAVELYVDSLGVFDLSKHNAVGGVLATYADLNAALTALNALESKYKYGGMSFKYIQSSDNKYVQYRYTVESTESADFTNEANWQGIDNVPIIRSYNLVEGDGISRNLLHIDLKNLPLRGGWPASNMKWQRVKSGGKHITIDLNELNQYETYSLFIKAKENRNCIFVCLTNQFVEPTTDDEDISQYLCIGETGRRIINANTSEFVDTPLDCRYICIGMIVDAVSPDADYSPAEVLGLEKDIRIDEAYRKVTNPDYQPQQDSKELVSSAGLCDILTDERNIIGTFLRDTIVNKIYHKTTHELVDAAGWSLKAYSVIPSQHYICSGKTGTNSSGITFLDYNGNFVSLVEISANTTFADMEIIVPQKANILLVGGDVTTGIPVAELATEYKDSIKNILQTFDNTKIKKGIGTLLYETLINKYYHATTHELVDAAGWYINLYDVEYGQTYLCTGRKGTNGAGIVFLDKDGDYLSQVTFEQDTTFVDESVTIPDGCKILLVGGNKVDMPNATLSNGLPNSITERLSNLEKKKISILIFGNSFSEDSFGYTPFILKNINRNVDLTIGIMYYGGCNLQQHYDFISNDSAVYSYHLYTNNATAWETSTNKKASDVLGDNWDYIFFQQQSTKSDDYTTFQPYLNDIINLVLNSKKNIRFGWNLTHAIHNTLQDSVTMFEAELDAVENVKNETLIEFFNPYGTAIQNARTTSLQSLGTGGNMLFDTHHLQEGLPCLVANYVSVMTIFKLIGLKDNVFGDTIVPDDSWATARNVPGRHGNNVGLNAANILLAQKCAFMAIKKPFEITDCSDL